MLGLLIQFNSEKSNNKLIRNKKKTINNHGDTTNNTNNGTINNNNINVYMPPRVAFGKEDLSFIDDTISKNIMNHGYDSLLEYIRVIHFNKDKPEYQNIYKHDLKDTNHISVYDGEKWNIERIKKILEYIKEKGFDFIESIYYKFDEDTEENKKIGTKTRRFIRAYKNKDQKLENLDDDMILVFYNNRNLIEKKDDGNILI